MIRDIVSALAGAGLLLAACGGPTSPTGAGAGGAGGGTSCPNDLPASCPTEVPSYQQDIAPLIKERCSPCHFEGGVEMSKLLETYAAVHALRSPVLNQVHACKMPPEGAPQLDAAERKLLFDWLVCGAPDN